MLRRRINLVLLPLLMIGLIGGLSQLFKLRFDHGDVYPHYSTYRADPMGAKALYQALDEVSGVEADRYHEADYQKLPHGKDHTLIALRVEPWRLMQMYLFSIENIERFMRQGGRVVIGIKPYPTKSFFEIQAEKSRERREERRRKKRAASRKKKKQDGEDEDPDLKDLDIDFPEKIKDYEEKDFINKWGIDLAWENLEWDEKHVAQPVSVVRENESPRELPGMLEWHSAGYFEIPEKIADEWTVHYRRDDLPVIIERRVGAGSIVLSTDPFMFSNQSLQENRHTTLLSWMLADSRKVVFDESHFGMVRQDGVASLGRKYQLHGLVVGLVVLGLLFVWKNSTSLVPPLDDPIASGAVTGRDSSTGFLNLLRRTIKPHQLLAVCVHEWRRSHPHLKEKGDALQQTSQFDRPKNDLVGRYHELREVLKPRVK